MFADLCFLRFCLFMLHYSLYCLQFNLAHLILSYLLISALQYTLHYWNYCICMQHACLCMLHASPHWLMSLKQSLLSFALYLINPKYISSFSACCPTILPQRRQSFSRGNRPFTFPWSTKHVNKSLACSQDFSKIFWRVEICSVALRPWQNCTGYHSALVQLF